MRNFEPYNVARKEPHAHMGGRFWLVRPGARYLAYRISPSAGHRVYWIVKFLQNLVKALNSEGTPGQIAAGMAIGACLGLTPLLSLHNLVIVGAILFFRVSVPGATLGWLIFTPIGFALDPVFDSLGTTLLSDTSALQGLWIFLYNTPGLALGNPTNTIVVGSFVF